MEVHWNHLRLLNFIEFNVQEYSAHTGTVRIRVLSEYKYSIFKSIQLAYMQSALSSIFTMASGEKFHLLLKL